ncbi:MAG: S8 family serine peptidase [Aureispira sp.]|nr:S8 family serine peptidase [Aureispira sp.]
MLSLAIYLTSFLSLALWFLFKEQKSVRSVFGKVFLASFVGYTAMAFLLPSTSSYGLIMDYAFLFGGGFFLNTFSNNKIVFAILTFVMASGYYYGVKGIDPFSSSNDNTATPNTTTVSSVAPKNLDPQSELLIEVANGHQMTELQTVVDKYNLDFELAFNVQSGEITELDDYYALNIPDGQLNNYDAIVADLQASGLVDHIEANEQIQLDPSEAAEAIEPMRRSYGVNDPQLSKVWGFEAMQVGKFYEFVQKNKVKAKRKAKIAIIDTGVDAEHEDLKVNFVSTSPTYNEDPHGHGTHCAGIAAAVSNNAIGIASFSPNNEFVEVTSIQVFGKYGNTSQRRIINGMLEAADVGSDVLSMSLGGPSNDRTQRAYKEAVNYANKKGAIVVVAAGNENMDAAQRAPASVDGVITVSAIDVALQKAKFSNTINSLKMGITAPGVQVYSTMPDGSYEYMNGTSMATPYVAGLVGVMKAIKPNLTTKDAYNILNQTGIKTKGGAKTGRLINPTAAVQQLLK